jgi:ankyrin repeat protein
MNGNPIRDKQGYVSSTKTSHFATFMEALSSGNPKVIALMAQQLCTSNSDEINTQDSVGNTVLHLAAMGDVSLRVFKLALRSKKINCNIKNKDGNTALHYLCQYCQTPEAAELCDEIIGRGSSVNIQNSLGESPLHKAMFNKHVRFILGEKLLRHGANINLQTNTGTKSFHLLRHC